MKTTLNSIELKELNACSSGYIIFKKAHGCSTVNLSQALESNGWDDIWWFISSAYGKFTIEQKKQIDLLGCGWAMNCLSNFEDKYPEDKRPREAIEAKIEFLKGEITEEELSAAWSAAESAARSAAESAAWSAAWSAARSATWSAARSATWSAAESAMEKELLELFLKWESDYARI